MDSSNADNFEDIQPDHTITLNIELSAKVGVHDYKVDATVIFDIELNRVLEVAASPMGDLSAILDKLGMDLGGDKKALMEKIGKPRATGVVKEINLKTLTLYNKDGKLDADLNKKGTLLATIEGKKIHINCENVFTFPKHPDAFVAIPSIEAMQKNIVVPLVDMGKEIDFEWVEDDELRVKGRVVIGS